MTFSNSRRLFDKWYRAQLFAWANSSCWQRTFLKSLQDGSILDQCSHKLVCLQTPWLSRLGPQSIMKYMIGCVDIKRQWEHSIPYPEGNKQRTRENLGEYFAGKKRNTPSLLALTKINKSRSKKTQGAVDEILKPHSNPLKRSFQNTIDESKSGAIPRPKSPEVFMS